MNWEIIGTGVVIIVIQGGILIAAAKSIFVTKIDRDSDIKDFNSKLYTKGITIFVPRKEWVESKNEREGRRDLSQRDICGEMQKLRESMDTFWDAQNKTNKSISHLLGRFEQYLEKSERK